MHLKEFSTSALASLVILVASSLGFICYGFVKTYIDSKTLANTLAGNIFLKYLSTSCQALIITSALELMMRFVLGLDIFLINWMAKLCMRSLIVMALFFVLGIGIFGFVELFRPDLYLNISYTIVKVLGVPCTMLPIVLGTFAHFGWCRKEAWTICPFDQPSYLQYVAILLTAIDVILIIGLLIQKSITSNSFSNTCDWRCRFFENSQVNPVQENPDQLVTISGNIEDAGNNIIPLTTTVSPATHLLSFLMVCIFHLIVQGLCQILEEGHCREVGIGFFVCLMVLPLNGVIWVFARDEIRKHAQKTLKRWLAREESY